MNYMKASSVADAAARLNESGWQLREDIIRVALDEALRHGMDPNARDAFVESLRGRMRVDIGMRWGDVR